MKDTFESEKRTQCDSRGAYLSRAPGRALSSGKVRSGFLPGPDVVVARLSVSNQHGSNDRGLVAISQSFSLNNRSFTQLFEADVASAHVRFGVLFLILPIHRGVNSCSIFMNLMKHTYIYSSTGSGTGGHSTSSTYLTFDVTWVYPPR